ncbi:MAG: HlyD family efflux transporter periplasmic adaptor subunit [Pirellulaceae bacterium]
MKPHIQINAPLPTHQRVAVRLVQSSRFAQRLAKWLLMTLLLICIGMAFLPWQQSSRGSGEVIAYVPQERQQTVQSPSKGIVDRVADGLVEGTVVRKGDFLLELQPDAADLKERLEAQVAQLETKEQAALRKVDVYRDVVTAFEEAAAFTVKSAEDLLESAIRKVSSKTELIRSYEAKELQARKNYERQQQLANRGVTAEMELEKYLKDWDVAKGELESLHQDIAALEKERDAKQNELEEKKREARAKIEKARADENSAVGELAMVRKEMQDVEIKLSSLERTTIVAPRDGTVFRMPVYERGQTVKEGQDLLTIVPEISQLAVELYIPGNDMPLVATGDHVRLQFEGWPAVQFAAWPSVAVGTFGGQVATVDATDNGEGKFRVLVLPDPESPEWPSEQFLRQGVRVNGWVMLNEVKLGWEIWRQLNGFPVIVSEDKAGKVPKTPKLPK